LKRVLIVPDQLISAEMGSSFFDRHSLVIHSAQRAEDAVSVARAFRPDLVILRSDLADVSAAELCRALRAVQPGVRLLLIHEFIGESESDYSGLVDARLVQPVDGDQLLATIAALLEIRVRRSPRAYVETLVQLAGFGVPDKSELSLANSIDVSEFGMLFETATQLELGAVGEISFFLPGSSTRLRIAGVARVVLDEVLLHYAVEFEGIGDAERLAIRAYVTEQLAERQSGERSQ
jgi:CheY-like chemotaxis protein